MVSDVCVCLRRFRTREGLGRLGSSRRFSRRGFGQGARQLAHGHGHGHFGVLDVDFNFGVGLAF